MSATLLDEVVAALWIGGAAAAYIKVQGRKPRPRKGRADPEYIARLEKELGLNQPRTAKDIHLELDGLYRLAQTQWTPELERRIEAVRVEYEAVAPQSVVRVPLDLEARVRAKQAQWEDALADLDSAPQHHLIKLNPGEDSRLWLLSDQCTCRNCQKKGRE